LTTGRIAPRTYRSSVCRRTNFV